jgi:hypothetical protein
MNVIRHRFVATAATAAIAAIGAFAGTAARADDITPDPYQHMVSTRTRAEVIAERDAAIKSGEIAALHGEDSGSVHLARLAPAGTLTRAQVLAEVLAARRDGTLAAMSGEDSGSFHLAARSGTDRHPQDVLIARVAR